MPRIRCSNLPPALRDHLFERLRERKITTEDLYKLKLWRESEPDAPEGQWYKDLGSFKICGKGKFPKTFHLAGQPANGKRQTALTLPDSDKSCPNEVRLSAFRFLSSPEQGNGWTGCLKSSNPNSGGSSQLALSSETPRRKSMKKHLVLIMSLVALFGALAVAADAQKPEAAAEAAAQTWLNLVDSGKYAASWDEAAEYFKSKITKSQWEEMLGTARTPLGGVRSRKLAQAEHVTELPNAPKGDYVVIQYSTSFANLPSAIETVVPMLDKKDGKWRVSGYFIKKTPQ
jgi:hypothetical protein